MILSFKKKLYITNMKKCSKCKIEKELSKFHRDKINKDGLRPECKDCRVKSSKSRYEKKKEYIKERVKNYYQENKERIKEYNKKWSKGNKEYLKEYRKKWNENNKENLNEYKRNKRKTDALFKMKDNLRSRTYKAFKRQGYSKNTKTQEMLGVDWEVAKQHIERQFTKGMNWDNQGEWHIDHIVPLASANNKEELKKLCHYSNLQPLWAEDNLEKKDKIIGQQVKFRI